MDWMDALEAALALDELVIGAAAAGDTTSASAPFVAYQRELFGLGQPLRLPEHFRGPLSAARVCFIGPHVSMVPEEQPPTEGSTATEYAAYYQGPAPRRLPYTHYEAVMEGAPYLATELVHWPCPKDLAMQVLGSARGSDVVSAGLALTWELLAASPVEVLVLTGNDAIRWVLPALGGRVRGLPGVTQLHAQPLGRFPLPGAPGRILSVIASFHWSPEMPLFVRKVPGLAGRPAKEAISGARAMLADSIRTALV